MATLNFLKEIKVFFNISWLVLLAAQMQVRKIAHLG